MGGRTLRRAGLAGAVVVALLSAAAQAQSGSAGAGGSVTVPVTITKTQDLKFGTVIRRVSGSAPVSLEARAGASASCGAGLVCSGLSQPAAFRVNGAPFAAISFSVDPTVRMTSASGGSLTATLSALDQNGSALSSILDSNGDVSIFVGVVVDISSDTPAGDYSGTFSLSADYQ